MNCCRRQGKDWKEEDNVDHWRIPKCNEHGGEEVFQSENSNGYQLAKRCTGYFVGKTRGNTQ